MKSAIAFCVSFLAALALARPGDDHYTDRYDNTNVEEVLSNAKLFKGYADCVLDQGKCTPDGKELRDNIQDALETECAKCTEAQKKGIKIVIKHLVNKEQGYWQQLKDKYDPESKWATKYEKELKEVSE